MSHSIDAVSSESLEWRIRARAYGKWLARGCPDGDGACDWYAARRELEAELATAQAARASSASTAPGALASSERERKAYEHHVAAFA